MPPHIARQWPLPARPATSAAASASSVMFAFPAPCRRVVAQDAPRRAVQVVELAMFGGPEEKPDGDRQQHDADGYEHENAFHRDSPQEERSSRSVSGRSLSVAFLTRLRRSALSVTRPAAASGTASML